MYSNAATPNCPVYSEDDNMYAESATMKTDKYEEKGIDQEVNSEEEEEEEEPKKEEEQQEEDDQEKTTDKKGLCYCLLSFNLFHNCKRLTLPSVYAMKLYNTMMN